MSTQTLANGHATEPMVNRLRSLLEPAWGYGFQNPRWRAGLPGAAVQSLVREGLRLRELAPSDDPCEWAITVARGVAIGDCPGAVLLCDDPGLIVCVANKLPGVRAVAVTTVLQAARATLTLGANLLAVEMPGRTYFEVRQIMRELFTNRMAAPADVLATLEELERCGSSR